MTPPQNHNSQVTVYEDTSWERVWSSEVGRLFGYARPWASLLATFGAGALAHSLWGHMPAVPWAAAGFSIGDVLLPGFAYFASRLAPVGRAHTVFTTAALMTWLDIATISGPTAAVTGGLLGILGSTLALSWNIRGHARTRSEAAHDPSDRLAAWFADAAKQNGLPGAKLTAITPGPTKATATVQLTDGKTAADLLSRVSAIESSAKLPPGAIITTLDPDRADRAGFSMSDPRVLTRPIPWPGPSAPGSSIAEPLGLGMWQDGEPVRYVIVGHHIYMMGMSGSGKSMGAAWNMLGEAMTRPDVCILGCDITKGYQTFGPLLPGINRFERDKKGAAALIGDIHGIIKTRTDFLSERGLQKWEPGCGLSYLICWFEETGDLMRALGSKSEDQMDSMALTLRSAGGTLVHSLQRNTYDQVNTIVRAQMSSMCFGLSDPNDCKYGLSEAQLDAGLNPAEWKTRHPGRAYLDAPTIPEDRITMPLRCYHWGEGKPASDAMTAHANAWSVSLRPVDQITAQICAAPVAPNGPVTGKPTERPAATVAVTGRPSITLIPAAAAALVPADDDHDQDVDVDAADDDLGDPVGEYLEGAEDPSPDITESANALFAQHGMDVPIEPGPDDEPFEFDTGEKMPPAEARAVFADQLAAWRAEGCETFRPGDFKEVMRKTGLTRQWIQARLKEEIESDHPTIEQEDGPRTCYRFLALATV
jgi:hypothetical protein